MKASGAVRLGTFDKSLIDRRTSSNRQLQEQLNKDAKFARIYGFTYEGAYYDLSRAVVFLVHGPGDLVTTDKLRDTNNPNYSAHQATLC